METPLKIDFHGAKSNEALQDHIVEHVAALERLYGRLTACHVGLEPPGHRQRKGGLYNVRIHMTLSGGKEVNVGTTPPRDKRHADVLFAINDAFRRARRQMQDKVGRMQGKVKSHEERTSGPMVPPEK